MKNFFSKYKYIFILFCLLTIVCGFIFIPYIISDTEFVLGWDMRTLYASNFEALRNLLKECISNKELPFWSWYSFLGNDYYSSKLFYFQDIFDYPFALTDLAYYIVIQIQTYLKFLIAGFSFYAYSRFNKYSHKTSIIGSLMFAFSAYGLQTMMHPFFGSFYVFLPLYFLAIDNYIYNKKYLGYIFITLFLFINNYYLFYSVTIFTVLYFIYRYYTYNHKIKGFFLSALPLVGCYFIGMLLSCFTLIPEAMAILANERVGNSSSFLLYDSIIPYINYITSIFIPSSILANRTTAISNIYSYVSLNDSVMAIFTWCSSILFLLFPQLFNNKQDTKKHLITFGVISLFALIPFLSSFMHGFSEPSFRWMQSPTFLLIVCILPFIENLDTINTKKLFYTLVIGILIIIFSPIITAMLANFNFKDMISDYLLLMPFIITALLIYYAIIKHNKILLIVFLTIELAICSYLSYIACPFFSSFTDKQMKDIHNVLLEENDYNNYIYSLDYNNYHQFYRTYVDPSSVYWDMSINLNYDFNIMGLMVYDSTYNATVNDLKKLDDIQSYLSWTFEINNPDLLNLTCTKYAIVTDESQVPFKNYHLAGEFNYFAIYENDDYYNLGKTYSKVITYDEYNNTSQVNDTIICNKEDYDTISNLLGNNTYYINSVIKTNNTLYADITAEEDSFLVLSVPNDPGWNITVNGKHVDSYSVNGGFIGIPLERGYNEIYMTFVPNGLKLGVILTGVGAVSLVITVYLLHKSHKKD